MKILIVAGGSGTRLWPLSRQNKPKQLLKLIEDKTLLETTYDRYQGFCKAEDIFLATTKTYVAVVKKQLPSIAPSHISIEPSRKETAPAIGLAALLIEHEAPGSIFMNAWSDHYIKETKKYHALLKAAENRIKKYPDEPILLGITPTTPEIRYGYIKFKSQVVDSKLNLHHVEEFKEKPDEVAAKKYLQSKKYVWNIGTIIWKTDRLLAAYQKYLPDIYAVLEKIKPYIGTKKQQWAIEKFYPEMPSVNLEQGLNVKLPKLTVAVAPLTWTDIGSWHAIKEILTNRDTDNLIKGSHVGHETNGSLIYNHGKQLIATLGIDNLVIINTPDSILIASKDKAAALKDLIAKIKRDPEGKKYL